MRTILKNYNEDYFEIIKDTKNNGKYYASYLVKKLDTYIRKINFKSNQYNLIINYNKDDKINIDYNNAYLDLKSLNGMTDLISVEIKYISNLIDIKSKELTEFDKKLITVYETFYKELPDFNSLDIEKKYLNMLYILKNYAIKSLILADNNYSNENIDETKIIKNWLHKMKKYINNYDIKINESFNIYLSIKDTKKINIIGNEIRNYVDRNIDLLDKISEMLYKWNNDWNFLFNIYENEKPKLVEPEGINEYKLIKKINKELSINKVL